VPNGGNGFDFFGSLGDALNSAIAAVQAALLALIDFIFAVLSFLYQVIVQIVLFLEKAFGVLIRGFKHVISDIVHGRFLHLYQDYVALKNKIKAWLEKHLPWLFELRKRFDFWWRHTIVPILNWIHRVRAILAVLRIFHVGFAKKLDELLAGLEAKIIKNTLVLRAKLNLVISIIDLVLDPGLLIRQNVLIDSAVRAIRQMFAALGLGFGRPLTTQEQADQDRARHATTRAGIGEDAASHPAVGLSAELLLEADKAERAIPPLEGNPESRLA